MESLRWFKFDTKIWNSGRISAESYEVQGVFLNASILYWDRSGDLDIQFLRRKIRRDDCIDELIESDLIQVDQNGNVNIKWIDGEIDLANTRRTNSKRAATMRWNAEAMQAHTGGNAKRKEKKRKQFIAPSLKDVQEFFKENNRTPDDASKFYYYYESQGWMKANGMSIKNWKMTCRSWWQKEEKPKFKLLNGNG